MAEHMRRLLAVGSIRGAVDRLEQLMHEVSELEVEDAKVEGGRSGGEVGLEQVYLDYRLKDWLTLRTGLVLVPIGIINETHEPTTFNGVERPLFDTVIIPTTCPGGKPTRAAPGEIPRLPVTMVPGLLTLLPVWGAWMKRSLPR